MQTTSDDLAARFGNRFLIEDVPDKRLPDEGTSPVEAMRLIGEEMVLDGDRVKTGTGY